MSEATRWRLVPVNPTDEQLRSMRFASMTGRGWPQGMYFAALDAAPPHPIPPERLAEMREAMRTYGPANCWTGTTGTLAAMVRELLNVIGEDTE